MLGLVAVSHPGRFAKITRLLSWLRVIIFCGLWYGSICSGFLLLYCPLLPLLLLHQKLFRKITDVFFAAWEMYPAALLECLIGTRIIVTGDAILPHDRALIIMNHRTRLDWNFLWAAMFYACKPLAHRLKIVLKAPIRHIPGAGWVMQMNCFLYIYRRWERDKELISRALDYFRDIGHTCQILLFPEGTDLTPENKKRSHQYACKHHLDLYHQVLHPKTTGFVFLVQRMKQNEQLDAIYDITVGYPRTLPQSEVDIIKGKFPEEVHFQITRFPGNTIPDSEEQLKSWLADRWKQKEQILTRFYTSGSFQQPEKVAAENTINGPIQPEFCDLNTSAEKVHKPNMCTSGNNIKAANFSLSPEKTLPLHKLEQIRSTTLYLALMFWTLLCFMTLYGLFTSFFLQIWAVVHITFFLFLSFVTQGFHDLEISLYRLKERYLVSRLKLS